MMIERQDVAKIVKLVHDLFNGGQQARSQYALPKRRPLDFVAQVAPVGYQMNALCAEIEPQIFNRQHAIAPGGQARVRDIGAGIFRYPENRRRRRPLPRDVSVVRSQIAIADGDRAAQRIAGIVEHAKLPQMLFDRDLTRCDSLGFLSRRVAMARHSGQCHQPRAVCDVQQSGVYFRAFQTERKIVAQTFQTIDFQPHGYSTAIISTGHERSGASRKIRQRSVRVRSFAARKRRWPWQAAAVSRPQ